MITKDFCFVHNGKQLVGCIDSPGQRNNTGYGVILVYGHARTDVTKADWLIGIRRALTSAGLFCVAWDKPGCGASDGIYDKDQTCRDSANEILSAIAQLCKDGIASTDRIGLWGISRAGWINAYVLEQCSVLPFWVSVSPGGKNDNYPYLLRSNLQIEGRSNSYIDLLIECLKNGDKLIQKGASYEEYLKARKVLMDDPFIMQFGTVGPDTEDAYAREVTKHNERNEILADDIQAALLSVRCPVLVMFGENDLFVDWRDSLKLYVDTVGKNGLLTVQTFPAMNHCLHNCTSGSYREAVENNQVDMDTDCIDAMISWLCKNGFAQQGAQPDAFGSG